MHARLEKEPPFFAGSHINSLSWKLSDNSEAEQEGYLASATREAVGVTITSVDNTYTCEEGKDRRPKHSFNFREHSGNVTVVEYNPKLDKIASCDSSGTVIVWRNQNGRATMELVNNRTTPIASFRWSHNGQRVLIAYEDGFILVGTASGRRLWARQLNIGTYVTHTQVRDGQVKVVSACWSPDDDRVIVGSSIGELVELDVNNGGMLISTTEVLPGIAIKGLEWIKGKPVLEQSKEGNVTEGTVSHPNPQGSYLTLYLANGKVVLMSSCGDQHATIIRTGLSEGNITWSKSTELLAVGGYRKSHNHTAVRLFKPSGQLLSTIVLPTKESVTAMTWAHDDCRLFIACGAYLFTVCVSYEVPSLHSLCQQIVLNCVNNRKDVLSTGLPFRLKQQLSEQFTSSIQGYTPRNSNGLIDYVNKLPPSGQRLYCTMVPDPQDTSNRQQNKPANNYTLYVEHLGGLVPILKASRKPAKMKSAFTISLPDRDTQDHIFNGCPSRPRSEESEQGSPRKRRKAVKSPNAPASSPIAEITSPMIGSKYKISGLAPDMPSNLGTVQIKTSILHMQPRRVQVSIPKSEDYDSGLDLTSDFTDDERESGSELMESDNSFSSSGSSRPGSPLFVPISSPRKRKLISQTAATENYSKTGWESNSRAKSNSPKKCLSAASDLVIHSRTPIWNDQHMIYQLDFGGRVTCKSAKNFQLETPEQDQVLQFGKISNGSFTLDFQGPFTPVQAFATALANIF